MDAISRFIKGLIMMRGIGFLMALLGITFVAPVFITYFTISLYQDAVSEEMAKTAYTVAVIAEIVMLLGLFAVKNPIVIGLPIVIVLLYCAGIGLACKAKRRKNKER